MSLQGLQNWLNTYLAIQETTQNSHKQPLLKEKMHWFSQSKYAINLILDLQVF